jgi:hypothetical protein
MTTTKNTEAAALRLAASLYQLAAELDEAPFTGTDAEMSATNERMTLTAIQNLHDFLVITQDALDDEWREAITWTASYDAWNAHHA